MGAINRQREIASLLRMAMAVILLAASSGCVERTLTLRSDPPGAAVVVNGEEAGIAPVKIHFETYGTFEVIMSLPRHARLRTKVPVEPPWYERVPFDFFVEVLWPFTIRDDHVVTLHLEPLGAGDESALDQRERALREKMQLGEGAPADTPPEGK